MEVSAEIDAATRRAVAFRWGKPIVSERRRNERRFLRHGLRVLHADTGSLLGHVVDLSTDGLMVASENPLPTGERLRLAVEIPCWDGGSEQLVVEAESRWCQTDSKRAFSDIGLRLTNPDEEAIARIRTVIEELTFAPKH